MQGKKTAGGKKAAQENTHRPDFLSIDRTKKRGRRNKCLERENKKREAGKVHFPENFSMKR